MTGKTTLAALLCAAVTASAPGVKATDTRPVFLDPATLMGPGALSSDHSEIRLTISPDGKTALWGSTNRPGGPGGWDIWMSTFEGDAWGKPVAVSFNGPANDFDPAFSPDGRYVYFFSNRAGGFGGDDIYRAPVTASGFGPAENLGPHINSAGDEWAPIPTPDGSRLLFATDGRGGAGRHDLFWATTGPDGFADAVALPGAINTDQDEFDGTFLMDGRTLIFARAPDLTKDRIDLIAASLQAGCFDKGTALPLTVNMPTSDTLGPVIDWSHPDRLLFSGNRSNSPTGADLYAIRYALEDTAGTKQHPTCEAGE